MNGRTIFEKYPVVIKTCVRVVKLLPRFISGGIWRMLNGSNWRGALLFRYCYLKSYANFIGANVYVGSGCVFKNLNGLNIGDNVSIHDFCYVDSIGGIRIGSDVSIAHASSILSFEHGYHDLALPIKYNPIKLLPVSIDRDVWVGCGVRILAGTSIGSRCVIAAGAVVRGKIEPFGVYGGVPARFLKKI